MAQPSVILAEAGYDHTIRFWEAKSGRCYRTLQYPDSQINRLEITPDKHYVAAAGNPQIRLYEVNSTSPQPVINYDSHTSNVMAVAFQCDGNWMYSGSEDGTKELISGDQNGNIRVWELTSNSCSCKLVRDGSFVVDANNHGMCYVWRLMGGMQIMTNFEPLHKLQAHDGYILKCQLSPEFFEPHRYLATTSSDHTVKIWNVDGFTLEKSLVGHRRWVWDCVFSSAYLIT
ncbi:hypothetical protein MKW94_029655, partial [Papaver nudicaule]|nr:hypothetical protein [Papaver nudicaule]